MKSSSSMSLRDRHPQRIDIVILIVLSIVFLVIGLSLPILTVRKLWDSNTYSVLTGIQNLWAQKYYVLAVIIFAFDALLTCSVLTMAYFRKTRIRLLDVATVLAQLVGPMLIVAACFAFLLFT